VGYVAHGLTPDPLPPTTTNSSSAPGAVAEAIRMALDGDHRIGFQVTLLQYALTHERR